MAARRLGVLGGTFNPIHLGHLHIARGAQRLFGLELVYFVVAASPPHKTLQNLIPLAHRYAMVSLATARSRSFIPSLIELEPPASPYSVHTMEKLASRNPVNREGLYFIAGGDSLAEIATWRESERLLVSHNFIFVTRPGAVLTNLASIIPEQAIPKVRYLVGLTPRQLRNRIRTEEDICGSRVFIVDMAALDISGSQIRDLARRGKRIRHLVPPLVHDYLQKTHLYGE